MKVNDVITEGKDLSQLKAAIEQGLSPTVISAGGSSDGFAWGDLRKLGWAVKHRERSGRTTMDEYWQYTGPNSISLSSYGTKAPVQMSTGDVTSTVEVDYD